MANRDLFEVLKRSVRCDYISDLRYSPWREQARKAIAAMELSEFSCLHSMTPQNICTGKSWPLQAVQTLRRISEKGAQHAG